MRRRFSSQFLGMNSTVVYEAENAYLIDPGVFPRETRRIEKYLQENGLSQISILLTHTHGDHISGWNRLPRYPTYGHVRIAAKSESVRNNDVRYLKGMFRKQGIEDLDDLTFPDNIQYLDEGEFKKIPPHSFAFFYVPGHAVDMTTIVVPGENLMFSGDMLVQIPAPFILNSTRKYWHSLKKFRKLVEEYDIRCLIPGHGKPAKSTEDILNRIRHEQEYLQKLVWEGIKLARTGMSGNALKQELLQLFDKMSQLHSHQANVQTFLRELDNWLDDRETDLAID